VMIVAICAGVVLLCGMLVAACFVRRMRHRREARPLAIGLPREGPVATTSLARSSSSRSPSRSPSRSRSRERSRRSSQSRVARAAPTSNYAAVSIATTANEYSDMVSLGDGSMRTSSYDTMRLDDRTARTHGYATTASYGTMDPSRRPDSSPSGDYQQGNLGMYGTVDPSRRSEASPADEYQQGNLEL
jgi:hypothetical protein